MPTCPDCGGIMIATEPYDVKISHGRGYRGTIHKMMELKCIDCGSKIGVPRSDNDSLRA